MWCILVFVVTSYFTIIGLMVQETGIERVLKVTHHRVSLDWRRSLGVYGCRLGIIGFAFSHTIIFLHGTVR